MRSRLFLGVFVAVLAFLAGPAAARGTLDSILPEIRAQHPGRLSDAEPWTDSDGRTHYRIKWMTPEGRILFFNADADSGRYSSSNGEDVGRQWRENGERHPARDDDQPYGDNDRGPRSHWNGGDGDNGGGDWRARRGGNDGGQGDWASGRPRGGDWRDRQSGGGQGDWRGGRGDTHGGGDWHGGGQGGGHHHHNEN
jgi:hypothetical protein